MVSAVSSQAATLNPLAYTVQTENDTKQAAPDATANDADRGPATQVSLSQEAIDSLKAAVEQGPDAARQALDAWSQASSDRFTASIKLMQATSAIDQANHQIERYDWQQETNKQLTDAIQGVQDSLDKWMAATPVPAVQLTKAQIADVLKKAAPLGFDPAKIGSADNYIFVVDDKQYTFKKDGTAWMRLAGVPTSEEEKQGGYRSMTESIRYMATRFEYPSVSREDLVAQRDALMAQ